MEISTRSRQKQLKERGTSERASRSLSRYRGRDEELDSGPRRSERGKIELTENRRRGRSSQRDPQDERNTKKFQKYSSESQSDEPNTDLRRKILKKSVKNNKSEPEKSESRIEKDNIELADIGSAEFASKIQDEISITEANSNGIEDKNEADGNESDQPLEEKWSEQESSPNPETESEFACIYKNIADHANVEEDLCDRDDKFSVVKRRKRRRRYNPKKKELAQKIKKDKLESKAEFPENDKDICDAEDHSKFENSDKDEDYEPYSKRSRLGLSMVSKLQTSKGFVDKVNFGVKPEELIPMRRTPRMASLNAIAKVNAVLESYSPLAGKTMSEIKEIANTRRIEIESKPKTDKRRKRSTSSVTQTDDIIYFPPLNSSDDWAASSAASNDVFDGSSSRFQPISDNRVSSTSNWTSEDDGTVTTKDKAVQTVANHKAVQTDAYLMHDRAAEVSLGNHSNCTCNSPDNSSPPADGPTGTTYYKIPPTVTGNTLKVPLRSSILTKTTTHTIAIPFTKTHVLSHMDMGDLESFPCQVTNTQSSKRMASLNAIAMMNAMKVLEKPFLGLTHFNGSSRRKDIEKSVGHHPEHIRIPKINFQATSTSKFSSGNKGKIPIPVKSAQLKNLSSQIERLIETKKSDIRPTSKMVNGWLFEGEPLEKPVVYDDRVVIRRYYSSMRRNAEVINVRDAVLLKSGPRKKDLPFVARVAAIWEEEEGFSAGDMMISVFWYYRPEQTDVGKIPGYNGDLEVLASRHRDDNSAACVVDKCYVLSYPQYCRFRARNKLIRESRKMPLSPVPPSESTRPGSMPPSNIDPNLVFFCRHAYDSRTGKIIKNPFY